MYASRQIHSTSNPYQTSLKRTKRQFNRLSTRECSNRYNKSLVKDIKTSIFKSSVHEDQSLDWTAISRKTDPILEQVQTNTSEIDPNYLHSLIQKVDSNIQNDHSDAQQKGGNKHVRHFYYNGLDRMLTFPAKIPEIVSEVYKQQYENKNYRESVNENNSYENKTRLSISFNYGVIDSIGYMYYSIEKQLILIKLQHLFQKANHKNRDASIPYSRIQMHSHVINITEFKQTPKVSPYSDHNSTKSMFPQQQKKFIFVMPWRFEFFALKQGPGQLVSFKETPQLQFPFIDLNTCYELPLEKISAIFCENGSIFYFGENGCLYHLSPTQETILSFIKTSRYTLGTYIRSKPQFIDHKMRVRKTSLLKNIWSYLSDITKSMLPKRFTAEKIAFDSNRNLLFAFLIERIEAPFIYEEKSVVFCYQLKSPSQKPTFLYHISEQNLYERIGSHIQKTNKSCFKIFSIEVLQSQNCYSSNLLIITKGGSRIYVNITSQMIKFNEMIRPPDLKILPERPSTNQSVSEYQRKVQKYSNTLLSHQQYTPAQSASQMPSFMPESQKYKSFLINYGFSQDNFITVFKSHEKYRLINLKTVSNNRASLIDINSMITQTQLDALMTKEINEKEVNIMNLPTLFYSIKKTQIKFPEALRKIEFRNNSKKGELSRQVSSLPTFQLLHTSSDISFMAYLRPIDAVFTTLLMVQRQNNCGKSHLSLEIILETIFLRWHGHKSEKQCINFSLIGCQQIDQIELGVMLYQLCYDKQGSYLFSKEIALHLLYIINELKSSKSPKPGNKTISYHSFQSYSDNELQNKKSMIHQFEKSRRNFAKVPRIISHREIPQNAINMAKTMLRKLGKNKKPYKEVSQNPEGDFWDSQNLFQTKIQHVQVDNYQEIRSEYTIEIFMKYLSRSFSNIWDQKMTELSHPQIYAFYANIIKNLRESLVELQPSLISDSTISNNNHKSIVLLLDTVDQLLLFIRQIPLKPKNIKFCDCLYNLTKQMVNGNKIKTSIFDLVVLKSIEKYYKPEIILRWVSLFPIFIDSHLRQVVSLTQEIQELIIKESNHDKRSDQILHSLTNSSLINRQGLPMYFIIQYLIMKNKLDGFTLRNFVKSSSFSAVYNEDGTYWDVEIIKKKHPGLKMVIENLLIGSENCEVLKERKLLKNISNILKKYKDKECPQKNSKSLKTVSKQKQIPQSTQISDMEYLLDLLGPQGIQKHLQTDELQGLTIVDKYFLMTDIKINIPITKAVQDKKLREKQGNTFEAQTDLQLEKQCEPELKRVALAKKNNILEKLLEYEKCITIQYQLFKHYADKIKLATTKESNIVIDRETQTLLKYQTIVDQNLLEKLIVSTFDSKIKLIYYSLFMETPSRKINISRVRNRYEGDQSNKQKFEQILDNYLHQYPFHKSRSAWKLPIQDFLDCYMNEVGFAIANKSGFSLTVLQSCLNYIQRYVINLNEVFRFDNFEGKNDTFGVQEEIMSWLRFENTDKSVLKSLKSKLMSNNNEIQEQFGVHKVFLVTSYLLQIGYQPAQIYQAQFNELDTLIQEIHQAAFSNQCISSREFQYWFKWLNCYILIEKFLMTSKTYKKVKNDIELRKGASYLEKTVEKKNNKNTMVQKFVTISERHLQVLKPRKQTRIGIEKMLGKLEIRCNS